MDISLAYHCFLLSLAIGKLLAIYCLQRKKSVDDQEDQETESVNDKNEQQTNPSCEKQGGVKNKWTSETIKVSAWCPPEGLENLESPSDDDISPSPEINNDSDFAIIELYRPTPQTEFLCDILSDQTDTFQAVLLNWNAIVDVN